jgi:mono/diheme cytochrome c family protein
MKGLGLAALLLLSGCEWIDPMMHQTKVKPYRRSDFYPDEIGMRHMPAATVEQSSPSDPAVATGRNPDGTLLARMPVAITREMLETGQKRFEVFCATCHGVLGNGQTPVARNMSSRPPPSLLEDAVRPDGFFFNVMTEGYGFMPSYRPWLDTEERWAVVAYLRALQLSQRARIDEAPPEVRVRLEKENR